MTVTPFQQRVYDAVSRIPCGHVATYKSVADIIGCGAPRAVGQALRNNPFAPRVPCHRVIAASGRIGGFQGKSGGAALRRKRDLLAREGVVFRDGTLLEPERLHHFKERS